MIWHSRHNDIIYFHPSALTHRKAQSKQWINKWLHKQVKCFSPLRNSEKASHHGLQRHGEWGSLSARRWALYLYSIAGEHFKLFHILWISTYSTLQAIMWHVGNYLGFGGEQNGLDSQLCHLFKNPEASGSNHFNVLI